MWRAHRRPAGIAFAGIVGFDQHAVHLHVTGGDLEAGRKSVEEALDDSLAVMPITPPCGPVMPTVVI